MEICDAALAEVMSTFGVEIAIGIGKFAECRIREILKNQAHQVQVFQSKKSFKMCNDATASYYLDWVHAPSKSDKPGSE